MVGSAFSLSGAVSPSIVLYDDGEIICAQAAADHSSYYAQKQLSSDEFEAVKKTLASFGDWQGTHPVYRDVMCFDCGITVLYLRLGDVRLKARVWGLATWKPEEKATGSRNAEEEASLLRMRHLNVYLRSLGFFSITPWEPRFFKVIFVESPLERRNPSVSVLHWPREWPGLDDERTERDIAVYTMYLSGSEMVRLKSMVGPPNHRVIAEIDGKQGTLRYRYMLPNEEEFGKNGDDKRP
jgi:hypothetical protein